MRTESVDLSTPSLGITVPGGYDVAVLDHGTFNSLSRDHWIEFIRYMQDSSYHLLNEKYGQWVPIDVAFESWREFVLKVLKANVGVSHPEVQATVISRAQNYLDWGVVTESELKEIGFIIENGKVVGTVKKSYRKPDMPVSEGSIEAEPPQMSEVERTSGVEGAERTTGSERVVEGGLMPVVEEEKKKEDRGLLALLALILAVFFLGRGEWVKWVVDYGA